nr:PREDICTED: LOW QUALITY PROTEIN: uncharacterized protein LOC100882452 [Megachile rotundata]
MFGRQIFLDSMNNESQQRRRNELLRQYLENQRHGTPFTELAIPSLRNDGLTLDLNFILLEDADRVRSNEMCFRTLVQENKQLRQIFAELLLNYSLTYFNNRRNACNRHLLEYIRQMEERYVAMEKELIRTKMLIPVITRNSKVVHQMVITTRYRYFYYSQTDMNWEGFSIANKYGSPWENPCNKYQESTNVSLRKKNHSTKRSKELNGKTFGDIDCTKKKISQNPQNDIYSMKHSTNNFYRDKTLINNSNAAYVTHKAPVFLPQTSIRSMNVFKCDKMNSKVTLIKICVGFAKFIAICVYRIVYINLQKRFDFFDRKKAPTTNDQVSFLLNYNCSKYNETSNKIRCVVFLEACQSLGEKHESEASFHTDFDIKHEDHTQASCTINTSEFQPIARSKVTSDVSERKFEIDQSTTDRQSNPRSDEKSAFKRMKMLENANVHRKENFHPGQTYQSNRNPCNNQWKKLSCDRTRSVNDPARNFAHLVEKRRKETYKTIPTPRSNVHTAYAPMVQPSTWNPMLDTNGFTIQLLRLAVLLYAPALMPALNLLIARQNAQTSIPIPCTEGSNDLLTQIFTILNNQQSVPNLPYVSSSRVGQNPRFPIESTSRNSMSNSNPHSENIAKQLRDGNCDTSRQFEKNSIAVNTSLEASTCTDTNMSSAQYKKSNSYDQSEVKEEIPEQINERK